MGTTAVAGAAGAGRRRGGDDWLHATLPLNGSTNASTCLMLSPRVLEMAGWLRREM